MSSKYAGSTTIVRPAVGRSQRRSGLLGLGAVLAGVTAVGAAVAIFLAPAEAPGTSSTVALPAMDASMGFWDHVDARPAVAPAPPRPIDLEITHDAVRGAAWAAGRPTDQPAPPSAEDGYYVRELPAMDASMGFWDFVTVPERPEAALPPMPASMGHWDFTLPAEPTRPAAAHTGR